MLFRRQGVVTPLKVIKKVEAVVENKEVVVEEEKKAKKVIKKKESEVKE